VKIDSDYQYLSESCTADDLLAAIVRAGHSNTRARRAVLAALCESNGQATPAQLLALGRVHQPNLGLITVYRTLEILSALGLVRMKGVAPTRSARRGSEIRSQGSGRPKGGGQLRPAKWRIPHTQRTRTAIT